jgi:formylmethanofuran dehydrogenase subunit E
MYDITFVEFTPEERSDMLRTLRCPKCNQYIENHEIRQNYCEYNEQYLTYLFNLALFDWEMFGV